MQIFDTIIILAIAVPVGGQATEPNKSLQQTGHANNGCARRHVFSRVSRLLSCGVRPLKMPSLFSRLSESVRTSRETVRFPVVDAAAITFTEEVFGFALPTILRRAYQEISNGGFGPGPIIGLPGGYKSSWGDLFQTWEELQRHPEYEDGWLPVIDWGCAQFSIIDCEDDFQMVSLYEGEFHSEDYSFEELLEHWLHGELPELHTGGFYRLNH